MNATWRITTTTTCTRPGITVPAGPGEQRAESPAQPMLLGGHSGSPGPRGCSGARESARRLQQPLGHPNPGRTPREAVSSARETQPRGSSGPEPARGGTGCTAAASGARHSGASFSARAAPLSDLQPRQPSRSACSLSPVSPAARLQDAKPRASKAAAGSHPRRFWAVAPRPFVTPLPIVRPRSRRCPISGGGRGQSQVACGCSATWTLPRA